MFSQDALANLRFGMTKVPQPGGRPGSTRSASGNGSMTSTAYSSGFHADVTMEGPRVSQQDREP